MWAIITKNKSIIARDFRTKPEALSYLKFKDKNITSGWKVIDQNKKEFIMIDYYSRKK